MLPPGTEAPGAVQSVCCALRPGARRCSCLKYAWPRGQDTSLAADCLLCNKKFCFVLFLLLLFGKLSIRFGWISTLHSILIGCILPSYSSDWIISATLLPKRQILNSSARGHWLTSLGLLFRKNKKTKQETNNSKKLGSFQSWEETAKGGKGG